LKRRNYNTAEWIGATLRGRTLHKFDAINILAIDRLQPFKLLNFIPGERLPGNGPVTGG
jgi:hypothetical protein